MAGQRPTRGRPRIDGSVIRDVQYQFEVNPCRNEEVVRGLWPCIVAIDRIAKKDVQYQFEVNRCRNEEVRVKGNFEWPMCGGGAPGLVMQPCIVYIDCIVIRDVQYQFEVNRCRNEEVNCDGQTDRLAEHKP
ncbi:hypothetical protein DPMN_160294 [Dreissena polymorpha]|uniref:Uncharacterized protein n=1 Tax=Dreissena polymorpha TaxID=45954 RepID=A0A9D4EKI8_DREPO|nr:hypothetical protein DPMN_160294 [Dreissena polymorpha]